MSHLTNDTFGNSANFPKPLNLAFWPWMSLNRWLWLLHLTQPLKPFFIAGEAETRFSSSLPTSTVVPWLMEPVTDGRDGSHWYQLWWLTVGSNMDHAPGHDLRYSLCADMTLHPGINSHAGRVWLLLNYGKGLIWVIYYKGFHFLLKCILKQCHSLCTIELHANISLNEVQWHHTPWCQRERGREMGEEEWGPQRGADKAGKEIPGIQKAMVHFS